MKKLLLGLMLTASLLMASDDPTAYGIDTATKLHCTYDTMKIAQEGAKWNKLSDKDKIRHQYDVKDSGDVIDMGKAIFKYDHSSDDMMIYFDTKSDRKLGLTSGKREEAVNGEFYFYYEIMLILEKSSVSGYCRVTKDK